MFIYVIGSEKGPLKIGVTMDPKRRLETLRTASADVLTLVYSVTVTDARAAERYAHNTLRNFRLKGEWFDVSPEFAVAAVKDAVQVVEEGPGLWDRVNGWDLAVGDQVQCVRLPPSHFPGPRPALGERYTVAEIYDGGSIDLIEAPNEWVTYCPSRFAPLGLVQR